MCFLPILWVVVVGPTRIRYAEMMVAFTRDARAPIRVRELFSMNRAWWPVVRGRIQLMYRWILPLLVLLAVFLLPMLWFMNPFSAIRILVDASSFVATAAATAVAALPRLLMGESPVVQGGIAGGAIALTVAAAAALLLFVWGMFQTGAYRFGYTRMPKLRDARPLLRKNLALWLPTLILFCVFAAFAFSELMLLIANVISAEAVFTVKLRPPQIVLLSLTAVSYLLACPCASETRRPGRRNDPE